jgi:hypothetical protein
MVDLHQRPRLPDVLNALHVYDTHFSLQHMLAKTQGYAHNITGCGNLCINSSTTNVD